MGREVKKLLLTDIAALFLATGMAHAAPCYASSWQICAYKLRHPELYSKWGIRCQGQCGYRTPSAAYMARQAARWRR